MKKSVMFAALLALAAATIFAPALLAGDDPKIKVHAEITTREEYIENHTDFEDTVDGADARDSVQFGFYRARVGLHADVGDGVTAYIEMQNHGTWGDSFALPSNPQDPLIGGLWLTNLAGSNSVQLYQAWVQWENIGDSLLSVKLGRQEHVLGNELHMGDADFYSGQYYDGLRATLDFETWDLDAFYYWIQERDVLPGSLANGSLVGGGNDDVTLFGLSADFEIAEGHELEPYALLFRQDNEFNLLLPKLNLWTIGALYDRPMEHDSPFDWSLEVAMQTGDAGFGGGETDVSSNVIEGWFGYTFGDEDDSHHRVHVGALMLGDGDDPQDIEAFIPLFPDTHRRAGMADIFSMTSTSAAVGGLTGGFHFLSSFHNLTDLNIGWQWWGDSQSFGAALHQFNATEDFGSPEDGLGQEIDLWYNYDHGEHLGLMVGVAMFSPGDFYKDVFPGVDDSVMRVFGQAKFRM
jgi:hypothetical protein